MANPQKENGFVPIANELLEAIYKADMTRNELRVLLCVIRYTYGYSKQTCDLSLREIAKNTSLTYQRVHESVTSLNVKKILFVTKSDGNRPQSLTVNKDYEKWVRCNGKRDSNGKRYSGVTENVTPHLLIKNNKDNIYIQQSNGKRYTTDSLPDWFEEVWKEYPSKKGKSKISKKSYKELSEAGRDQLLTAVRNYKAYCDKNQWYHPQNGSTFFNGGWKDYLTNEPAKPENEYAGMDFYEIFEAMDAAKKGDAN